MRHPPDPADLERRISEAAAEIVGAEHDLRALLEALPSADRPEKQIISVALQGALEKLAAAKVRLAREKSGD
jgi:hypothetical protein